MPSGRSVLQVLDDPRFDAHTAHGYHPERAERLAAARSGLASAIPAARRRALEPTLATAEELGRVHEPGYLRRLTVELRSGRGQLDADTFFSEGTHTAAWLAAGGTARMARELLRDRGGRGLALVRPPGHHATPSDAKGFCLLNNVAIGAATALASGARRVAIVDWDVHHGNGTQDVFERDPRVLFVSLHQSDLYPHYSGKPTEVGVGAGAGHTVNVALPAGSGPEVYGEAFRKLVLPLLDHFEADLTLVSAGFDAHARDPLASMELDSPSFGALASALVAQAERAGHGRVAFVLEGGYDLVALESSVAAVARAALGHRTALPEGAISAAAHVALARTEAAIAPHWQGLFGPA
jgi:acetoin utilization deacetylase AcuC-like enzyme